MVTHYEDIISFAWCCVWESYIGLILCCTVRDRATRLTYGTVSDCRTFELMIVSHSVPQWCCHVIWVVGDVLWSSGLEMDSFERVRRARMFFRKDPLRRKEGVTRIR